MQYREGTVNLTFNDNAVVGSGVNWTDIPAGSLFALPNVQGVYEVLEVVSPTELRLVTPWKGATLTGQQYWLTTDFTPNHGLPLLNRNDVDAARIVSEAMRLIDGKLQGASAGGAADVIPLWARSILSTPPSDATEGNVYIVGPNATGAWAGRSNFLATFTNGAWVFKAPRSGQLCLVTNINDFMVYRSGAWENSPSQFTKWENISGKPSAYAPTTHTHPASQITGVLNLAQIPNIPANKITGVLDVSQIPVMAPPEGGGSINAVISSGGLTDLTTAQLGEINKGTIVTTTDGFRWLYSGTGSKTTSTSYVQLADITPAWDVISGKPSIFPTDIANVAGLQAALNSANSGNKNFSSITLDNPSTASNHITFRKDLSQQFRIINGTDNNLNVQMWDSTGTLQNKMVFHSNGNITLRGPVNFDVRPTFASGAVPWDSANLAANSLVRTTGDQNITGNLFLHAPSAYIGLILNGKSTGSKELIFRNEGSNRWIVRTNTTAEGEGDAGQNFEITPFSNEGVSKGWALQINRATRVTNFAVAPTVGGQAVWHKGEFSNPLDQKGNIQAGASNDLNQYQTSGIYFCDTNAKAAEGSNYPQAQAGMLEVIGNASFTYQRYTVYQATGGMKVWHRERYTTSWGDWKLLTDSANGGDTFFRKDAIPLFAGEANGSEGGEIRLVKPPSGSTIGGNVSVDVFADRLRIFEGGGAFRGFYLDFNEGVAGHARIAHSNNLDALNIARRNATNTFVGTQKVEATSTQWGLWVETTGNVTNDDYSVGTEVVISSYQPRIMFHDRSSNAKHIIQHYNSGAMSWMYDTAGDGKYSDPLMRLNANKTLQVGGNTVLTEVTGVTKSATNLGRTDNVPLIGGTRNAAWWSGLPTGYNVMTNLTTANGSPISGYGYFLKMARRDADGGWCGLWQGYHSGELYFGGGNSAADMPVWHRVWNSANFNPVGKLDCATNGWRNDADGHPRFWFGTNGTAQGRSYYRGDGHEWRSKSDAHIFSVADNGTLAIQGDVWHQAGGYGVLYARTSDKFTFLRGENIVFRNNSANATLGEFRADGKFYANGDIYNGNGTWFRVRGSGVGIHWESHSGGWFMNDTNWMRSYNNKGILTTGAVSMGSFTVTSDKRIKSGFKPITKHGEIIDATKVYEFTKDKGTDREVRTYGVIAQEAAKVVPLLVKPSGAKHTDGTDLLGVDLTGYIPIMLEELKALRKRVAELEGAGA